MESTAVGMACLSIKGVVLYSLRRLQNARSSSVWFQRPGPCGVSSWCWNSVCGLSSQTAVASRSLRFQECSECRPPSNEYRKFEVEETKLLLSNMCCRIMLSLSSQESMCRTSRVKLLSSFSGVAPPQPGGGSLFGSCVGFSGTS